MLRRSALVEIPLDAPDRAQDHPRNVLLEVFSPHSVLGTAHADRPDGGIIGAAKTATLAEANDVAIAPHNPIGPIAFAASVHVGVASPSALIQQQPWGLLEQGSGDLFGELIEAGSFEYAEGYVDVPDRPGLGIDIDERALRERAGMDVEFQFPRWRHPDGSLARW